MAIRNQQLDALWDSWPQARHPGFHRDGIIDEATDLQQQSRLLFVMLEGSAADEGNREHLGADLRELYRSGRPRKALTHNLARWTKILLDGESVEAPLPEGALARELQRIAVINLDKVTGGSSAVKNKVWTAARSSRELLRQQVEIIGPDLIVTCGKLANDIFARVMRGDPTVKPPKNQVWSVNGVSILPALHPSHRKSTLVGNNRVLELARDGRAGS